MDLNGDPPRRITIAVRIRPFTSRELQLPENKLAVQIPLPGVINCFKGGSEDRISHTYTVDHSFWSFSANESSEGPGSQQEVYDTLAKPLLRRALKGYNACLFAYGVTSSGKTYSMHGTHKNPGIVPRLAKDLFKELETSMKSNSRTTVQLSYYEIYNERLIDLLQDKPSPPGLSVREHPVNGPFVEGLVQPVVSSPQEVLTWIQVGDGRRSVAATVINKRSSRSHSIATFLITRRELVKFTAKETIENVYTSKLNLVDLAGSERQSINFNHNARLVESCQINKSLFTLGRVIAQLSGEAENPFSLRPGSAKARSTEKATVRRDYGIAGNSAKSVIFRTPQVLIKNRGRKPVSSFISYRDSLLTWILKESLGGNSVTAMLATVSPSSLHFEDTLSTLQYAKRAQSIINPAVINEDPQGKIIRELMSEVERLRKQINFATDPGSPLASQIRTLQALLRAREREVSFLNSQLTKRIMESSLTTVAATGATRTQSDRIRKESCINTARAIDAISSPLRTPPATKRELMFARTGSSTPFLPPGKTKNQSDSAFFTSSGRRTPDGSDKVESISVDGGDLNQELFSSKANWHPDEMADSYFENVLRIVVSKVVHIRTLAASLIRQLAGCEEKTESNSFSKSDIYTMQNTILNLMEVFTKLQDSFILKKTDRMDASGETDEQELGFGLININYWRKLKDATESNNVLTSVVTSDEISKIVVNRNEWNALLQENSKLKLRASIFEGLLRSHPSLLQSAEELGLKPVSSDTSPELETEVAYLKFQLNGNRLANSSRSMDEKRETCTCDQQGIVKPSQSMLSALEHEKIAYTDASTSVVADEFGLEIISKSDLRISLNKLSAARAQLASSPTIEDKNSSARVNSEFPWIEREIEILNLALQRTTSGQLCDSSALTDDDILDVKVIKKSDFISMQDEFWELQSKIKALDNVHCVDSWSMTLDDQLDTELISKAELCDLKSRLRDFESVECTDAITMTCEDDFQVYTVEKEKLPTIVRTIEGHQFLEDACERVTTVNYCTMTNEDDLGVKIVSSSFFASMESELCYLKRQMGDFKEMERNGASTLLNEDDLNVKRVPKSEFTWTKQEHRSLALKLSGVRQVHASTMTTEFTIMQDGISGLEVMLPALKSVERVDVAVMVQENDLNFCLRIKEKFTEMEAKLVYLQTRVNCFENTPRVNRSTSILPSQLGLTMLSVSEFSSLCVQAQELKMLRSIKRIDSSSMTQDEELGIHVVPKSQFLGTLELICDLQNKLESFLNIDRVDASTNTMTTSFGINGLPTAVLKSVENVVDDINRTAATEPSEVTLKKLAEAKRRLAAFAIERNRITKQLSELQIQVEELLGERDLMQAKLDTSLVHISITEKENQNLKKERDSLIKIITQTLRNRLPKFPYRTSSYTSLEIGSAEQPKGLQSQKDCLLEKIDVMFGDSHLLPVPGHANNAGSGETSEFVSRRSCSVPRHKL